MHGKSRARAAQAQPLTPSQESAIPQEMNGFSPTVKPLRIDYDILYLQSLGYTVRDLQYNFFTNIYAGADVSVLSNHLFEGFQIVSWAWAKVPFKVVWATRNDGRFLSFTFDKEEQLQGWSRHDTNGLVSGNEVAIEPPAYAPYFVVKRFIPGYNQWAYYIERMDNRLWEGPEDPWCIDAGLELAQGTPNATLAAAAAEGAGTITGGYIATTGQDYTNPSAQVIDPAGTGSGALITLTQSGGQINGFTIVDEGRITRLAPTCRSAIRPARARPSSRSCRRTSRLRRPLPCSARTILAMSFASAAARRRSLRS